MNLQALEQELLALLHDQLHLQVDHAETDLLSEGLLDSLLLVDLLFRLEQRYGVAIEIDNLDTEQFRSVRRLAQFLAQRRRQP